MTTENQQKETPTCLDAVPFSMIPFDDPDIEKAAKVRPKSKQKQGTPVCEAILNLLSDMLGTGLLALPYVVLKGGIASIVSMLVIPVICYYTGKVLIDCLYEKSYKDLRYRVRSSYKDIGDACWPRYGGLITVGIQTTQLVLLAASCIVLSASLISHMLQYLELGDRMWIFIAAVVGLPMIFAKDMSQVAWLSLLSIASLFAAVVVITGYGYSKSQPWDFSELSSGEPQGIPLAISIITFSYVAHGVLPTIEATLSERSKFNCMLAMTYLFCAVVRTLFAISGFFAFHDNIHEIVSNSLPLGSPIHITVNGLLVAYSILCYPFVAITIIHITETSIVPKSVQEKIPETVWYISTRVCLTLVTVATALLVPYFPVLIAISGNLAACVAFILPSLFHLRLKFDELSIWQILLDFWVLAIGVAISIIGTIFAVRELV